MRKLGTQIVKCISCHEMKEVFGHQKCDRCYHREYYHLHKENARRSRKKYLSTENGRRKHRENYKKYKKKNYKKILVHKKLNSRIQRGTIKKKNICTECGVTKNIHCHHPDYNKPFEFIELCPLCHKKIHPGHKQLFDEIGPWLRSGNS